MRTFTLLDGTQPRTLDDTGGVSANGASIGSWSTTAQGAIRITTSAGESSPSNVEWFFNGQNHLCLAQNGAQIFDFHGDGPTLPGLRLGPLATLYVRPVSSAPFEFALQPEWSITPNHDLQFQLGNRASVIDGVISDNNSAFRFHFIDKADILEKYTLLFKGEWHNDDTTGPGGVRYDYSVPGPQGATLTRSFRLPNKLTVNSTTNTLAYRYEKAGRTRSVQLTGQFSFRDFKLTYSIDRKESAEGATSTLNFDVNVAGATNTGSIVFALRTATGDASSTTFAIGGKFSRRFENGVLDLTFGFQQQTIGGVTTSRELTFSGALTHHGGTVFRFALQTGAASTTIEVAAEHLQLGPVTADAKVTVTLQSGEIKAVTAMFGIAF